MTSAVVSSFASIGAYKLTDAKVLSAIEAVPQTATRVELQAYARNFAKGQLAMSGMIIICKYLQMRECDCKYTFYDCKQ